MAVGSVQVTVVPVLPAATLVETSLTQSMTGGVVSTKWENKIETILKSITDSQPRRAEWEGLLLSCEKIPAHLYYCGQNPVGYSTFILVLVYVCAAQRAKNRGLENGLLQNLGS